MKPSIFLLMVDYLQRVDNENYINNVWLYGLEMEIYVRKGRHILNENVITCLDIANVTVYDKGKGTFTIFLNAMEIIIKSYDSFEAIHVENVMSPRFCRFLEKHGYTQIPDSLPPSYYKFK